MPLGDRVPWSGLPRHNARAIADATGPFPASSCDPPALQSRGDKNLSPPGRNH